MQILLTNDDGFYAPGLQSLYEVLHSDTNHTISIVAPEGQRSAASHSITLFEPLFVNEHVLEKGNRGFSIKGTPSDCVKLAIQGDIIPKPDLVISGINKGQNLGIDVFYSGTVSAAMEGVLLGIPAIAISLASYDYNDFKPAAKFLIRNLERVLKIQQRGLLNINIPGISEKEWKGTKVTKLGKAIYENIFEQRKDPRGRSYFWQSGNLIVENDPDTDLSAINEGYISMTPLHSDLTDYEKLSKIKDLTKLI